MPAYLLVYGRDPTDRFAAHRFVARAEAVAAAVTPIVPAVPVDGYGRIDPKREVRPGVGGCAYVIENEEDALQLSGPLQVALYRSLTGDALARFESRAVGARRLLDALRARFEPAFPEKPTEENTVSDTTTSRGRRPRFTDDQRIELLVTENPKKPGKKNHDRFAALMAMRNPTVGKAVEAGVTLGDLAYDQEKGYLRIHPSSGSAATPSNREAAE